MPLSLASANFTGFQGILKPNVPATIAMGAQNSSVVLQNGFSLAGIQLPAAFTSTAITFLGSLDGVTFQPVYNSAGLVSYTVAQGRYIAINPADLQGLAQIQIVAGTAEAAARTLTLSLKGI
jgi:hypothetical protein